MECSFGADCINYNCSRVHPAGRKQLCHYGHDCTSSKCKAMRLHPKAGHGAAAAARGAAGAGHAKPCKFRAGCTRYGCHFAHPPGRPRDCKHGFACHGRASGACPFLHPAASGAGAGAGAGAGSGAGSMALVPCRRAGHAAAVRAAPGAMHGHEHVHAGTSTYTSTSSTSTSSTEAVSRRVVVRDVVPAAPPARTRVVKQRKVIEACLCFDTTGSMYKYLDEVRKGLADLVSGLVRVAGENDTDLRIGIIAHGDYCDKGSSYVIKFLPLLSVGSASMEPAKLEENLANVLAFVRTVGPTGGGDAPEAYELALSKAAHKMGWGPHSRRVMVMVGDANPHEPGYKCGDFTNTIDWREQLAWLAKKKVRIYAVKAGKYERSRPFWQKLADDTGGRRLDVSDMETVPDLMVMAVAREMGDKAFRACTRRIQERRGGGAFRGELAAGYRLIETVEVVRRTRVVARPGAGARPGPGPGAARGGAAGHGKGRGHGA